MMNPRPRVRASRKLTAATISLATAMTAVAASLAVALTAATSALAQDWNPFGDGQPTYRLPQKQAPARDKAYLPPMDGRVPRGPDAQRAANQTPVAPSETTPYQGDPSTIESSDLAPVGGATSSATWNNLDAKTAQELLIGLDLPSRSPVLTRLWKSVLLGEPGAAGSGDLLAVRLEALQRSGLIKEAADLLASSRAQEGDPLLSALAARLDVTTGERERGCAAAQGKGLGRGDLPPPLRAEMILIGGYCAAAAGNRGVAGLAAELAREEGHSAIWGVSALDAIAQGRKPRLDSAKRVSPIEYLLFRLAGGDDVAGVLDRADPALIGVLVRDASLDGSKVQIAVGEAAVRLNIIEPRELADIYRKQRFSRDELSHADRADPLARRALLVRAAENDSSPLRRARFVRGALDDARRNQLYLPMLVLTGRIVENLGPSAELGWFAETAVETLLAAGNFERAREWARVGDVAGAGLGLGHWLALVDIADPSSRARRGEDLVSVEALALRGRFTPDSLHRLATVLDALDYNVPMRLWEAASRAPQPNGGHLPATGVLRELQDAAKSRDRVRVVALTIKALGPTAGEGAHIIALGDAIRALRRAGFEAEARQVGVEALLASWPRGSVN